MISIAVIPGILWAWVGRLLVLASLGKTARAYLKNNLKQKDWMHGSSSRTRHNALNSKPAAFKNKKKEEEEKK
jgi:hypothetical protein